jgi:hypothetical protein
MSHSRRGYPIGALFVLVAVCAVMLAGISPLMRMAEGEIESLHVLTAVGCGVLVGLVTGLILGLLQFRMGLGIVLGVSVGAIIGAAGGLMALLSAQQMLPAAAAMTAGSALVVGVAYVMRRAT